MWRNAACAGCVGARDRIGRDGQGSAKVGARRSRASVPGPRVAWVGGGGIQVVASAAMGSRAGFLGTMLAVAAAAHPAGALTLLTSGKVGDFRPTRASVRVGADRALRTLRRPTCPAVSSVRFALSRRGDDFEDHDEVALPCTGWRAARGGYRYHAPDGGPGGGREIGYTPRRLVIPPEGSGSCVYCHNK